MAPEEFLQGQLIELHKTCAATQQAVTDLTGKFDHFIDFARELDKRTTVNDAHIVKVENSIAVTAAASDASASTKAKFWAAIGSGISLLVGIAGGIFGDWLLFRH